MSSDDLKPHEQVKSMPNWKGKFSIIQTNRMNIWKGQL